MTSGLEAKSPGPPASGRGTLATRRGTNAMGSATTVGMSLDKEMTWQGVRYRVVGGRVEAHNGDTWRTCSRQELLRAGPRYCDLWDWLRQHGVRRTSPSGGGGEVVTNPYRVTIRLSEEDLEKLKGSAAERGVTVNGLVTDMIRRLR